MDTRWSKGIANVCGGVCHDRGGGPLDTCLGMVETPPVDPAGGPPVIYICICNHTACLRTGGPCCDIIMEASDSALGCLPRYWLRSQSTGNLVRYLTLPTHPGIYLIIPSIFFKKRTTCSGAHVYAYSTVYQYLRSGEALCSEFCASSSSVTCKHCTNDELGAG